jgi:leucyl aminopeptidase
MKFQFYLSFALAIPFVHAQIISHEEIVTNSSEGLRLLSLTEGADPVWKTENEKLELLRSGIKFVSPKSSYLAVVCN